MKIKSLLIGSAALMTASSGAYAADAIVMAEPEPVEYVRVCDVYGAGFFYIPGTETCLKIGGYVRFQVNFPAAGGYTNYARFTPTFDVRSENEWGTLRGYAEVEINAVNTVGTLQTYNIAHAFIEQTLGGGTLRLGRTHTPYARFLGYTSSLVNDGAYGFRNTQEISYQFNGSNGFSAIIAVVDNNTDASWATDVEGGVNFAQGWGSIGAIAGYDGVTGNWGAKGVARVKSGAFEAGLHVFWASGAGSYQILDPLAALPLPTTDHWSVQGHVRFDFTPKAAAVVSAQWWDYSGGWQFVGGLDLRPVGDGTRDLRIRPEIVYNTSGGVTAWSGLVRFDRRF